MWQPAQTRQVPFSLHCKVYSPTPYTTLHSLDCNLGTPHSTRSRVHTHTLWDTHREMVQDGARFPKSRPRLTESYPRPKKRRKVKKVIQGQKRFTLIHSNPQLQYSYLLHGLHMVIPQFCMGFSHDFCCLNQGFFWLNQTFCPWNPVQRQFGSPCRTQVLEQLREAGLLPRRAVAWTKARKTNGYQEIFGDHPIYDHHLHFLNQWTLFFSVAKSWSLWVNPLFLSVVARILIALINSGWWFGTWFLFFHDILGKFIPTDFHIFQRGGSTTNQYGLSMDTSVLAYHW